MFSCVSCRNKKKKKKNTGNGDAATPVSAPTQKPQKMDKVHVVAMKIENIH